MTPTEQDKELREKLAAIEHERWAGWQRYVHSVCYENKGIGGEPTGALTIPSELARRWDKQIETPYEQLSEREKDSDREQVRRYLPIIKALIAQERRKAKIEELERLVKEHGHADLSDDAWLEITHNTIRDRIAELKEDKEA